MLGVIHRAVMGRRPEQVRIFFVPDTSSHMHGRNTKRRHSMQLQTFRKGKFLETTGRSILGLVDIYNLLPQEFIDHTDVHEFQGELQKLLKIQAEKNQIEWETLFSPRLPSHAHPLRRLLNGVVSTGEECVNDGMPAGANVTTDLATTQDVPPSWW